MRVAYIFLLSIWRRLCLALGALCLRLGDPCGLRRRPLALVGAAARLLRANLVAVEAARTAPAGRRAEAALAALWGWGPAPPSAGQLEGLLRALLPPGWPALDCWFCVEPAPAGDPFVACLRLGLPAPGRPLPPAQLRCAGGLGEPRSRPFRLGAADLPMLLVPPGE